MSNKKQVIDWTENPITIQLKEHIKIELAQTVMAKGLDAFHPFQPERTQEILANLNGAQETWELMLDFLEGDWDYLEVDSEGEKSGEE